MVGEVAVAGEGDGVDKPAGAGGAGVGGEGPADAEGGVCVFGSVGEVDDGFDESSAVSRPGLEAGEGAPIGGFSGVFDGGVVAIAGEGGAGTCRGDVEPGSVVEGEFQAASVLSALKVTALPEFQLEIAGVGRDGDGG